MHEKKKSLDLSIMMVPCKVTYFSIVIERSSLVVPFLELVTDEARESSLGNFDGLLAYFYDVHTATLVTSHSSRRNRGSLTCFQSSKLYPFDEPTLQ